MKIIIDFRSGIPIYVQIVEQIQQEVAQGKLKPGDQLPTVRQLATELRVNFNTVARAYRILDEAGVISTQQGRGTYIWDQVDEDAHQKIRRAGIAAITIKYFAQSKQLGYSPEEIKTAFEEQYQQWINGKDNSASDADNKIHFPGEDYE